MGPGHMPGAYFVSDIHITAADSPRGRLFLKFLRGLSAGSGTSHLVLLGDIFDLWVADHDYFVNAYGEIIEELRRLREEGVEIRYFEGNHDLHLRYYWADRLGLIVHPDPAYVDIGDMTVRLEHGDQMDPDDKGYLFLRWFLRTPPIRWLVCHLPGSVVAGIGDRASAKSRDYTSNTKSISADAAVGKIRAHAEKVYAEKPFDLLISGHVHVRDDWQSETADFRSVNLGSWFDAPCYFKIDADGARFCELSVDDEEQAMADTATVTG